MKHHLSSKRWWGAPKKFSTENRDRKISWLELFYDLVYVIAISTITHYLAQQFSVNGMLDYFYMFVIIFWGWLNGSLYHDLHGNEGLRTKLMTLWQMLIISALVITLHSDSAHLLFNATIVLLVMQIYITYLWWSVGFYDKAHRRLNRPYTILYLASFGSILATLFIRQPYIRIFFFLTLFLNYLPPFVSTFMLRKKGLELTLSSSMTERLGLFTIIIFGEVVLGVTNGIIAVHHLDAAVWLRFIIAITIVFTLWWLFFTMVSDRRCKPGLLNSSIFELLFVPTLIGLGLLAAAFNGLFTYYNTPVAQATWITRALGFSISVFLVGIGTMMSLLEYPVIFLQFKKTANQAFIVAAATIAAFTWYHLPINLIIYLLIVLMILIGLILYLNTIWFRMLRQSDGSVPKN